MSYRGLVDIVAGGQFGDEGKGQIAAWLTHRAVAEGEPYGFAVRTGGSNAEHRFNDPENRRFTGRVLPCAAWIDPNIKLVLGAGHMIKLDSFFREVQQLEDRFGPDQKKRIIIDANAGVIEPAHQQKSRETAWRGSTHQGTGAAVAHKVLRDGKFRTASKYPELEPFVVDCAAAMMDRWMRAGECGLVEGSQGALLSLDHGYYPFCTAKNVTPPAVIAEAGIAINRVRHIWGVYRAMPMRVPGNSGPSDGREVSWEELEEALGRRIPEEDKRQTDSGDRERIFVWSWNEFYKSLILLEPTHIALTFMDWYVPKWNDGMAAEEFVRRVFEVAGVRHGIVRYGQRFEEYHEWSEK